MGDYRNFGQDFELVIAAILWGVGVALLVFAVLLGVALDWISWARAGFIVAVAGAFLAGRFGWRRGDDDAS